MSTGSATTDDQDLRSRAVKRWKKQRDFRIHLLMYRDVPTETEIRREIDRLRAQT